MDVACPPFAAPVPASAAAAIGMLERAAEFLAATTPGTLTIDEQAAVLRGLARSESRLTAARACALSGFVAGGGLETDGQCSARTWLIWQSRITRGAAAGAVGWMKRLAAHPLMADALAAGEISASWARQLCEWTERLPEEQRGDGDSILLAAAAGGADLADLAGLAEEMYRRTARPDQDDPRGFADRALTLEVTFGGAGRLAGNLTPECTAAVSAMLAAIGKNAGPEDDRTKGQRDHDALEEAARRLASSGFLPDRAGQPTVVQLRMTLDQLRAQPGSPEAEAAWTAARAETARAAADGQPDGWPLDPAAAAAYSCDAKIAPIVTGNLDPGVLASQTLRYRTRCPGPAASGTGPDDGRPLDPATVQRLRDTLLRHAADLLSGPAGLAAALRKATGHFPSVSLPLEAGATTDQIPPRLRSLVIARDRHCAFAGCRQPAMACQVHHIVPRSRGGPTTVANLVLLCSFHHLIAIHRWGWTITLHADGTTTVVSPDKTKTFHSHSPPGQSAA